MQFLKELLDLYKLVDLEQGKKDNGPHLKMTKLSSFVTGDTVREGKETVKVEVPKPRNKQLNDTLKGRKGGRHYDARSDYVRAKEKHKARNMMESELESDDKYFEVSWYVEHKNRSGEGPETYDCKDDTTIKAASKEEAIAKIKARVKGATNFRAVQVSKPSYDD